MTISLALLLAAQAAAPQASQQADDPIICTRRGDSEVGTHMSPKKTCLHKSDWDLIEKHTQREIQMLHDKHLDPGRADGHGVPPK